MSVAVPAAGTAAAPGTVGARAAGELVQGEELVRVRVWDLVVRVTHWTIALSLGVLAVSGLYIGRPFLLAPGPAGERFVMGTVKAIHSYAAIAFTLAVLARLVWMFVGTRHARWWNFVPVDRGRRKGLWGTFLFYTFVRPNPPPFVGHNPLAGLTYVLVFGLYLVMIASGLGLYAVSAGVDSPMGWLAPLLAIFGGPQNARWFHHVATWLLIGFTVHHVYSAILVATVEKSGTIDSIFSGWKWLPRAQVEAERGAAGEREGAAKGEGA